MKIDLIGFTHIDWAKYLSFCKEVYGNVPTRKLDSSKLKFNEQLTFPFTLNELRGFNKEPVETIRGGGLYMDTVSILFMADKIDFDWYGAVRKFDLPNQSALLVGTLREWKDTVQTNLSFSDDYNRKRRQFFNQLLGVFEAYDFRLIWDNYSRERLPDKTVILKEK